MMHPYQNSVVLSNFYGIKKAATVYWNEHIKTYIVVYEDSNGQTRSAEFFHRQVAEDSAEDHCISV